MNVSSNIDGGTGPPSRESHLTLVYDSSVNTGSALNLTKTSSGGTDEICSKRPHKCNP